MKPRARRINKPLFEWRIPSSKQEQILYWWTDTSPYKNMPYAAFEGAVRSVKTASSSYSFINWASFRYDQEDFALCAKTIGTCIKNVIRPLRKMLSIEPSYNVIERRSNPEGYNLEITQEELGHINIFWIYGGKDESSQDLIQGKTLAGLFLDEAPLMPQSFINQGLARLSVENAKAWFTLNPEPPTHPIYIETLDPFQKDGKLFYLHLTMDDNPSLSEEAKNRIKSQWPIGSLLYRRYVLGERATAEGRVFGFFDPDPEKGYVVMDPPDHFIMFLAGLDYGIVNPFAASLWGLSGGIWYVLKEFYWDSVIEKKQKTNPEYVEDMARLCTWKGKPIFPETILVPPEEPEFQRELKQSKYPQLSGVRDADNKIMPGIEDLTTLFALSKLKISLNCPKIIWGINNLLWDAKKQAQGTDMYLKGGSNSPDHICDMMRYIGRRARKEIR